jgi:hypothetical protein
MSQDKSKSFPYFEVQGVDRAILDRSLLLSLPIKEIRDIVSEYDDFFDIAEYQNYQLPVSDDELIIDIAAILYKIPNLYNECLAKWFKTKYAGLFVIHTEIADMVSEDNTLDEAMNIGYKLIESGKVSFYEIFNLLRFYNPPRLHPLVKMIVEKIGPFNSDVESSTSDNNMRGLKGSFEDEITESLEEHKIEDMEHSETLKLKFANENVIELMNAQKQLMENLHEQIINQQNEQRNRLSRLGKEKNNLSSKNKKLHEKNSELLDMISALKKENISLSQKLSHFKLEKNGEASVLLQMEMLKNNHKIELSKTKSEQNRENRLVKLKETHRLEVENLHEQIKELHSSLEEANERITIFEVQAAGKVTTSRKNRKKTETNTLISPDTKDDHVKGYVGSHTNDTVDNKNTGHPQVGENEEQDEADSIYELIDFKPSVN